MEDVLKHKDGKKFLQSIDPNVALSMKEKRKLANLISDYYIEKSINLSKHSIDSLSKQIKQRFPKEDRDTYYISGKSPGGLLYQKYHNSKSRLNKDNPSKKRKLEEKSDESQEKYFTDDVIQADIFVRGHPNESQFGILMDQWQKSAELRRHTIQSSHLTAALIFDKYKAYARSDGNVLVYIYLII